MSEQPLVSVIINCFNGEKYLRATSLRDRDKVVEAPSQATRQIGDIV